MQSLDRAVWRPHGEHVGWLDAKSRPYGATDANGLFRIADTKKKTEREEIKTKVIWQQLQTYIPAVE